MSDVKMARAQKVYATMCQALDARDWKYQRDDEALRIRCTAQGDDLPMEVQIIIDADRQLISLLSHLPFVIPEEKRLDVAIAVSIANNGLVDGSFDYDIGDGHMFFRMTSSFIESEIGNDLFLYMLFCSLQTIDVYNDRFLMLGKDLMTLKQFIEKE